MAAAAGRAPPHRSSRRGGHRQASAASGRDPDPSSRSGATAPRAEEDLPGKGPCHLAAQAQPSAAPLGDNGGATHAPHEREP
jgi:hypothetical protein